MTINTYQATYKPVKVEIETHKNEFGSFESYGMFFENGDYICVHSKDIFSIEK